MNTAPTVAPPRRLRADAARNQQRILEAGARLFAERGLEVTLDDVAEAAQVGVGTVYRRFANKRELIAEVLERNVNAMAEAVEQAYRNPDPWASVMEIFEWVCEHTAANRGFGEVLFELPDATERFESMRDRIRPAMNMLIDRAQQAGELRAGITATDFFALVNMIEAMGFVVRGVRPDAWRRYVPLLLDSIRADGRPRLPLTVPALTDEEVRAAKAACFANRKR